MVHHGQKIKSIPEEPVAHRPGAAQQRHHPRGDKERLGALDYDAEHVLYRILVTVESAAPHRKTSGHFGIDPFLVDVLEGNLPGAVDLYSPAICTAGRVCMIS